MSSELFRAHTSAATARAPLGRSKLRIADEASVRAGCSARVDLHRPLANVKVGIQIGLKAVLEHRAPKTSTPILHSRGVESKVGRAVPCARSSAHRKTSGGQRTPSRNRDQVLAKHSLPVWL